MMNLILQLLENEALKTLFLKLMNMSISASWLVLAVLVLRFALKKAPKWVNVVLWGIVAVRLICPFSIESAFSLIPSTETIPMNIEMAARPAINSGIDVVNSVVNPIISASFAPNPGASANPLQIWIPVTSVIWLLGMVVMALYTAISYFRLYRMLNTAVLYEKNIFQSENVTTPFVLGIFRPRIYLPFQIAEGDLAHVVAHEQAHISRRDHWWKPLGFLLLTIYWFNPIMWLAYVLLCRDIELACDEKVIQKLSNEQRADYTQALVSCSINRLIIAACPLAFGEVGVKDRVKTIMNYKKPTFWLILVALILCVIVAVCFLTDPIQEKNSRSFLNYKHSISMSEHQDVIPAVHYTSVNDQGSIGIGMVEGKAFATYLDTAQWTEKWFAPTDLSSPGSVAVNVADNLRITIYDRKFAAVEFNDEVCYYRINANDYQRIQDLLLPADSERLEMASETRLELALGIVTIKENDTQSKKLRLSLNDVIILSQKGYDLNWADFDQYEYIETGFGLYIRVYEINDMFRLMIGGNHPEGYPDKDPMYIYLTLVEDKETKIDIRDGGVTEFIAEHKTDSAETWDRIPMVMVNGTLYLDTGRESTVMARCGMMDGEITSQVPGNEEPTVDDQSNFGIGYGYQYGALEGTIEIHMNGKWWIFATEEARKKIHFPIESIESKIPDRQTVEEYLIDYTINRVAPGLKKADITILTITDRYALVHTFGESPELIVYHYTFDKIYGNINITGIVRGDSDSSTEMSINHFRMDDQHVYFGTIKLNHGQSVENALLPAEKLSVKFIGESGEAFETSLQDNSFYLTTLESPLESFELLDSEEQVLWDLERYLNHGYVIQECSLLIAALGSNGTRGFVKAEDLDGDLPSNPAEAVAYMEEMARKTAYGTKKYVRLIPLYAEDGVTVIGEFAIG